MMIVPSPPSDSTRNDHINIYIISEIIYRDILGVPAPTDPRASRPDLSAWYRETK